MKFLNLAVKKKCSFVGMEMKFLLSCFPDPPLPRQLTATKGFLYLCQSCRPFDLFSAFFQCES
uniref:Uncharacterized protein n=1 Tax=Rhizophora mucronata TaxID=61149 RepID=A0A2P2MQ71_RHIMU